jgi:hypothetical protein
VFIVRGNIKAVLFTVTVAFGTADPDESVTTPVILPVTAICAEIKAGKKQNKTNAIKMRYLIAPPKIHKSNRLGPDKQLATPAAFLQVRTCV